MEEHSYKPTPPEEIEISCGVKQRARRGRGQGRGNDRKNEMAIGREKVIMCDPY
jgi:hypothetical protein